MLALVGRWDLSSNMGRVWQQCSTESTGFEEILCRCQLLVSAKEITDCLMGHPSWACRSNPHPNWIWEQTRCEFQLLRKPSYEPFYQTDIGNFFLFSVFLVEKRSTEGGKKWMYKDQSHCLAKCLPKAMGWRISPDMTLLEDAEP